MSASHMAFLVAALVAVPDLAAEGQRKAQRPPAARTTAQPAVAASAVSAPISDVRYEVTFDATTARERTLKVVTTFNVAGREPVLLSLPAWTPGAYEISNFARWVSDFAATGDGKPLEWDKLDYDTWRVRPGGARAVRVSFDFLADSNDNAMSWSRDNFAFFNGTNIFMYADGRPLEFAAQVTVNTDAQWKVATGMKPTGRSRTYGATNYHDLVDMPFFVGRFDLDSAKVADRWVRLATWPEGSLTGAPRAQFWDQHQKMIPPQIAVFQDTPFVSYTTLIVFDSTSGGGSALEHQNSHIGIYSPLMVGSVLLPSITAHEIFHAWNVKRLRPADLTPYRYDRAQPTPWLWVSEGITDYYADVVLARGGIVDSTTFLRLTQGKIDEVAGAPPVALEDASLSTWIHPTDGSGYIYYQKGSLAGFMLDIMIRDASDNKKSLDDVMRDLYHTTYKKGKGFTADEWWSAVSRAANGKSFADFHKRYIDGREPYPWPQVLPLAGLRIRGDTIREPRIGVLTEPDSAGVRVTQVEPGSAAHSAGVQVGDYLISIGDVAVTDPAFGVRFRQRYAAPGGPSTLPARVRRGTETLSLTLPLRFVSRVQETLTYDTGASAKAVRIRNGILRGVGER